MQVIITKLIGGLGNQMFQYAVARRLAYIYNETFKLDITAFQYYQLREYYLNSFNIVEQIATTDEIDSLKTRRFKETYFHFDPLVLRLSGDLYLEGYWQCEKYFKDIAAIIRQDFSVKQPLSGTNLELANHIKRCEAVAVHFRHGDYVTNPVTHQYHGVCPLDYYQRAMQKIASQVQEPHFFIFSDDPEWVAQQVRLEYPFTVVTVNGIKQPHEDLRLMSLCKRHIIANSTFSWWGAWLSTYDDKRVYAPRKWFNNANLYCRDLIPEAWNLL
jgi:hypothetical protein